MAFATPFADECAHRRLRLVGGELPHAEQPVRVGPVGARDKGRVRRHDLAHLGESLGPHHPIEASRQFVGRLAPQRSRSHDGREPVGCDGSGGWAGHGAGGATVALPGRGAILRRDACVTGGHEFLQQGVAGAAITVDERHPSSTGEALITKDLLDARVVSRFPILQCLRRISSGARLCLPEDGA